MIDRILTLEPHITIHYNAIDDILFADWTGEQTRETIMDGCEKMLLYLKQFRCQKILNDNTNVTSIWSHAAEWVETDWFPRLSAAGCAFLAWIYSPNIYSKLSADEALRFGTGSIITITFHDKSTAESWLKVM